MPDSSRIEDLRRRVQNDPASIAFAQLAEEYRRARRYDESVTTCQTGLKIHPRFLSARITLGRALIELGRLDEACEELTLVLKSEPRNLAAIRALADAYRRRGAWSEALMQYRAALELASNDPDLARAVNELAAQTATEPAPLPVVSPEAEATSQRPASEPRLRERSSSLERSLLERSLTERSSLERLALDQPVMAPPVERASEEHPSVERPAVDHLSVELPLAERLPTDRVPVEAAPVERSTPEGASPERAERASSEEISLEHAHSDAVAVPSPTAKARDRESRVLASLEQWLTAIHVSRAQRHP